MSICIHSKVSVTEYFRYDLERIHVMIPKIWERFVMLYGSGIKLFWPEEKIIQALLNYKELVSMEVPKDFFPAVGTIYDLVKIIGVFDVSNGNCTLYGSWMLHSTTGEPVMRSHGTGIGQNAILYKWQLFNPDLL